MGEMPQSYLPAPDVGPAVRVPRNVEEVAAQIALAIDGDKAPFKDRYGRNVAHINASGQDALLSQVLSEEVDSRIAGAREQAMVYAKNMDSARTEFASRIAATLEAGKAAATNPQNNPAKAQGVVATRALEMLGMQYAQRVYKDMDRYSRVLDGAAGDVAVRNIMAQEVAPIASEVSLWDTAQHFFGSFIPFAYDFRANRIVSKITGESFTVDTFGAVTSLRNYMLGLQPQERHEVVKALLKEDFGIFGDNKSAKVDFIRKVMELTKEEANMDFALNAFQAADVAALMKGLWGLARKGVPLVGVKKAAGEEAAGRMAASDLVQGTKIAGLNDAELVARVLAGGVNPLEADPAALRGLNTAAQDKLRGDWDTLLTAVKERINSAGLTPEEVQEAAARIRASYAPATDQRIYNVEFGEASANGQQLTVYWQGNDGKAFLTKEMAEQYAKDHNLVGSVVVPKNSLEEGAERLSAGGKLRMEVSDESPFLRDETISRLAGKKPDEIEVAFRAFFGDKADDPEAGALLGMFSDQLKKGKQAVVPLRKVLDTIESVAVDPESRFLAGLLKSKMDKLDLEKIPVRLSSTQVQMEGAYNALRDNIRITANAADDPTLYLHEAVHAHNAQVLTLVRSKPDLAKRLLTADQIAASNDVIDLTRRLKKWHGQADLKEAAKLGSLKEELGSYTLAKFGRTVLENPEELLAYGLTDERFRTMLQKIKLSELGYTGDQATVWSKLWDAFARILGLRADDTALAKLVKGFEGLADTIGPEQRNIMTRVADAGLLDRRAVANLIGTPFRREGDGVGAAVGVAAPEEWLIKQTRTDPLSYDSVGRFSRKDIDSMPWVAVDPKHGASEAAIEARVVGVHAEAKTQKELTKFIEPYYRGLSKDSKKRVQALLEEGDSFSNAGNFGREFTYMEARAKGLNDDEAVAYLATRQLRMAMYHIRNGEMVRHMRALGMREVELMGAGLSLKTVGRQLDLGQASAHVDQWLYDIAAKKNVKLNSKEMADAYGVGKHLVRLEQPQKIDGTLRQTFLADASTAKVRDIVTAVNYRPGEFARIYTDQYFIVASKAAEVDGVLRNINETVRTANSSREAQEFVDGFNGALYLLRKGYGGADTNQKLEKLIGNYFSVEDFRKAFDEGEFDGVTKLDFHYTRNKDEYLNGSVGEAISNGKLFTSKRTERLYSVDKDRQNTLGVFQSLEAEITNVSRVANINQWRETMVRRWMNTFGELLPRRTGDDVADFYSAAGATFTKGNQESVFAERTHRYIMRQIGLRTDEERFYENVTRRMTEKFFSGNEPIEAVGAKIRQMGVLGFIRNINFNLTLGMFNPAQLLIQANGAATALVLSPLHGAAAAKTFPLLRMALMSDNPQVWKFLGTADSLTSLGLTSAEEFADLVKAVRKTGIIDNLRSTSLWNKEEGKHNIFTGYPSKVLGSHAFFFNRGEEFSRLVSFDVARREWMAKNAGADWRSTEALQQIVVRMDDLTQNMTKANLARFQEGLTSIPLQFAQYNIKLAANVMSALLGKGEGRGFTKPEAIQLMLGHILLYGAAGNGLVALLDEVLPQEVKDTMPVQAKLYLTQGLIAGLVGQVGEWATGERTAVALGSRMGSFNYYQQVADALFTDPKSVYEALMGPTVTTAKRLGTIGDVAYLWFKDPDLSARDIMDGLAKMSTEQVSSLRNPAKAYLYHQHSGKMLDSKGFAIAQLTPPEVLFQALGFQPVAAVDVNNMIKSKREHNQALDDIAKTIFKVQRDIMTARLKGDHAYADEQHKLLQALWPVNTGDMLEVQRRIRDRLYPHDSEFQRLLSDYLMKGQTYDRPLITTQQPRTE